MIFHLVSSTVQGERSNNVFSFFRAVSCFSVNVSKVSRRLIGLRVRTRFDSSMSRDRNGISPYGNDPPRSDYDSDS